MNIELKLSQNNQRRKRDVLLKKLSDDIIRYLKGAEFHYTEDVFSKHGLSLFPKVENAKNVFPEGYAKYEYIEVDQLSNLKDIICNKNMEYTRDCLVSLDPEAPFMVVSKNNMPEFVSTYTTEVASKYLSLMVFQDDYQKGFVVDTYCGYLPTHLRTNSDEIVYEFVYWER